ncbi:MAG: hypothetical protein CM15mV34_0740 [Caudoviricetes sp.]|nr:MAG: hypothetical protein CM15mV34_0740 [Caudoviricetes sp.]
MGTKKISQLETISDSNLSGEAILPVVVSDPLIPNRKAKVNQLFKGVAQGTKDAPGLCFDLDRDSGLYQSAYDQLGMSFGDGGLYMSRIVNSSTSASLYVTAVDDTRDNSDIVFSPKGTGSVKVTGQFVIDDGSFILEDAQGPKARFEISNIGTGTNTRIMTLPTITSGNGTVLVGDDTQQTLRNKTILIDEDNLVITDGNEEAIFQINWPTSLDTRRSYFLPDAGTVTTTAEPTATASTLLDTKSEQIVLSKQFVDVKFAPTAEANAFYAQVNTSALTANRTITVPDLNVTLVGTGATQVLSNKSIQGLILADTTDVTKKLTFDLSNVNTGTNQTLEFPPTDNLNNSGADNVIVLERAIQTMRGKTLIDPKFDRVDSGGGATFTVQVDTTNITGNRTVKFPDADATLLSTQNVTLEDVSFGAGIGAQNLTGQTRQQQFFYAGF